MKNDDWRSYADGSATPIDARQSVNQQSAVANRQRDVADFARDVARDLALTPKQLQSKYLYDALGSSLFEAICRLPWYRITRAEQQLLERHAPEVVARMCPHVETEPLIVELGCGSGEKIVILAEALQGSGRRGRVHLIDISPQALEQSERTLGRLRHIHTLQLAYDDPLGVTAAFNRNLLVRINRELDGDFDLDAFAHVAVWNREHQRVEMHLESLKDQRVRIGALSSSSHATVSFAKGERIWTESSYKYEPADVDAMGRSAGFVTTEQWIDEDAGFALTLLRAKA